MSAAAAQAQQGAVKININGVGIFSSQTVRELLTKLGDTGGGKIIHVESGIELEDDDMIDLGEYEYHASSVAPMPNFEFITLTQEYGGWIDFQIVRHQLRGQGEVPIRLQMPSSYGFVFHELKVAPQMLNKEKITKAAAALLGTEEDNVKLEGEFTADATIIVSTIDSSKAAFPQGVREDPPLPPLMMMPHGDHPIRLEIRSIAGKIIRLPLVFPSLSVGWIKYHLQALQGISPIQQKLMLNGKEMQSWKLVSEYSQVKDGSVLQLSR